MSIKSPTRENRAATSTSMDYAEPSKNKAQYHAHDTKDIYTEPDSVSFLVYAWAHSASFTFEGAERPCGKFFQVDASNSNYCQRYQDGNF